jgi:hypothetical protein
LKNEPFSIERKIGLGVLAAESQLFYILQVPFAGHRDRILLCRDRPE